jgi:hypothetical protein
MSASCILRTANSAVFGGDGTFLTLTLMSYTPNTVQIADLLERHMLYIGFSMRDGAAGYYEMFRFAMHHEGPPFDLKNGKKLTKPQEVLDFGFKTAVLLETSFAFNVRRMETMLQSHFWDHPHRLWRARGAGSYFVSENRQVAPTRIRY